VIDRKQLENEVLELIRKHAGIGYSFDKDGVIDGNTLFIAAEGAAHVVVHHILTALTSAKGEP
jgi:hypothetical protein